jgi:hypothetical protein
VGVGVDVPVGAGVEVGVCVRVAVGVGIGVKVGIGVVPTRALKTRLPATCRYDATMNRYVDPALAGMARRESRSLVPISSLQATSVRSGHDPTNALSTVS